jgi:PAS domain S-box-containing protein
MTGSSSSPNPPGNADHDVQIQVALRTLFEWLERRSVSPDSSDELASNPLFQELVNRLMKERLLPQITERIEAEEELRVSEMRFHSLADATFEGIVIHEQGRILEVNRAAAQMFGYDSAEVVGKSIFDFVDPACWPTVEGQIRAGGEQLYETVGKRRNGMLFDMLVQARGYSYGGRKVRVVAVRDVTQSKRDQQQIRLLERQKALESERGRIARDMHDEAGASITRIKLLSERIQKDAILPGPALSHVQLIAQTAQDLAESLDEIVWAVNPQKDRLENLVSYLLTFSERHLGVTNLRFRLDIPDVFPDVPMAAPLRHSLFLAIKEALHNVVQHAAATEVWLRFRSLPGGLTVEVQDNGRGFELTAVASECNGLRNIRRRLADAGGLCVIRSQPGHGTNLTLSIPTSSWLSD